MSRWWNAVSNCALFVSVIVLTFPFAAQAQYPDKQINMVVCFPAGGGTDIAARMINTPAWRSPRKTSRR